MNRLTEAIEQEVPYCPDSDYEIGYNNGLNMAKAIAIKLDAVPVVRCKDCQEFSPGFIRPYLGWCSVWDTTVRETGFCHHGKTRSEEKPKPAWPPQEEMEEPCED